MERFRPIDPREFDLEAIEAARRMTPEERLAMGPQLFDAATRLLEAGVRAEFPNASQDEIARRVESRWRLARALDDSD